MFDGLLRISSRKTKAESRLLTSLVVHDGAICDKTRQDKTRQLYLARMTQLAARLVALGALGSIGLNIHIYNKTTRLNKIC